MLNVRDKRELAVHCRLETAVMFQWMSADIFWKHQIGKLLINIFYF